MKDCACAQGAEAAIARAAATPRIVRFMVVVLPKPPRKLAGRARPVNPSKRHNRTALKGRSGTIFGEPAGCGDVAHSTSAAGRRGAHRYWQVLLERHVQALGDVGAEARGDGDAATDFLRGHVGGPDRVAAGAEERVG